MRVLITGVGSTTAISVIKGLRNQNEYEVYIVGVDINDAEDIAGSAFCDKFYKVPKAVNEGAYLAKLNDIIQMEKIDLVIPIIDIELEVIARNIKHFSDTYILISSYNTILICNDKYMTYKFFLEQGIPTPKTLLIDDISYSGILEALRRNKMDFPLLVKPRFGVSSRGIYEIKNEEEIFLVKRVSNPIFQEKIIGHEYTIDVFAQNGKVISVVPRERKEVRAGISYKGQTVKDEALIKYASKISEILNLNGPANIQCFKNVKGIYFFEINPRFSGSLPLTIAAGVNTPLFALKMAKQEKLLPKYDFNLVKMCRYWEEVFYD